MTRREPTSWKRLLGTACTCILAVVGGIQAVAASSGTANDWPVGYYGNVRWIPEAGDLLGQEVHFYRDCEHPMVEWVDCEGWCKTTHRAPLTRTDDGFVFEYDDHHGDEGQLLHWRVDLRPTDGGFMAYTSADEVPLDESSGAKLKRLRESVGVAAAHRRAENER